MTSFKKNAIQEAIPFCSYFLKFVVMKKLIVLLMMGILFFPSIIQAKPYKDKIVTVISRESKVTILGPVKERDIPMLLLLKGFKDGKCDCKVKKAKKPPQ